MTPSHDHPHALADVLANSARGIAAVVLHDEADLNGVAIGYRTPATIDVLVDQTIHAFQSTCHATRIVDDEVEHRLLIAAVTELNRWRHDLAAEQVADERAHQHILRQIRSYVIDQYMQKARYSLAQLNDFLGHFDLPAYAPRVEIVLGLDVDDEIGPRDSYTVTSVGPVSLDISGYQRYTGTTTRVGVEVESARVLPESGPSASLHPPYGPDAAASPRSAEPVRTIMVAGRVEAATVLSTIDSEWIEVIGENGLCRLPQGSVLSEIVNPDLSAPALATAVAHLVGLRDQAHQRRRESRETRDRTMAEIRRYAIARHLDGLFCLDGLNTFLRVFGLPEHSQ